MLPCHFLSQHTESTFQTLPRGTDGYVVTARVADSGLAQRRSPFKRAAGEENFGPQKGLSLKNQVSRSPERIGKEALSSRTPSADPGPTACCLLMHLLLLLPRLPYHLASSRAAVHSARTTALQPPDSWCDALIKVLAVRSVAYHKKLPLFASSSDDGSVHVYHGRVFADLLTNALIVPLKMLKGHSIVDHIGVLDIAFHPTQPWIFSCGADGAIHLYCS